MGTKVAPEPKIMFGKQCQCRFDLEPDKEEEYKQPCHAILLDSILSCCDKRTPRQKLRGKGSKKSCLGKTYDGIMDLRSRIELFWPVRALLALLTFGRMPVDVVSDTIVTVNLFNSESLQAAWGSTVGFSFVLS